LLLVDQRISMFFGSQLKMKSVIAAELAALACWRVISTGDRVGALVFNDMTITSTRPRRSRHAVMRILHNLLQLNHALTAQYAHAANEAQLNLVLQEAERLCGHDYLIVLISDMAGWNTETLKRLKRLGRHNDVIASFVFDPLEQSLAQSGELVFSDGRRQIQVDASEARLKTQYRDDFVDAVNTIQQALSKHGIPVIPMNTVDAVQHQVRSAIGEHRGRRRR